VQLLGHAVGIVTWFLFILKNGFVQFHSYLFCTIIYTLYTDVSVNMMIIISYHTISKGQAMAQFVEALHYKLEGRGFDS
jgi:hypoxanthine-guanine phosphoribosyltransferase